MLCAALFCSALLAAAGTGRKVHFPLCAVHHGVRASGRIVVHCMLTSLHGNPKLNQRAEHAHQNQAHKPPTFERAPVRLCACTVAHVCTEIHFSEPQCTQCGDTVGSHRAPLAHIALLHAHRTDRQTDTLTNARAHTRKHSLTRVREHTHRSTHSRTHAQTQAHTHTFLNTSEAY